MGVAATNRAATHREPRHLALCGARRMGAQSDHVKEVWLSLPLLKARKNEEVISNIDSTVTGLDRNAVNYQLKKLRKIINIERSGSDKKGSWKITPK